jgi:hypothetical protein
MPGFDWVAEQKILEALARGELDDLPGAGRPLALDDDALVPQDLRLAYRILKNAGFVPPEVEARREIAELERLLYEGAALDETARARAAKKLALLRTRIEPFYAERLLGRLARR